MPLFHFYKYSTFIMKKKNLLLAMLICISTLNIAAQEKKFKFDFYGQIRTDIFYNSRASQEMIDGLFYLYPLDKDLDANGRDLNERFSGNFYVLTSRLGVNITGPKLGNATTFAKVEGDFRGAGSNLYTIRMRHAYFQLNWDKADLLLGQTWHPLFGEVYPRVLNLSTGAPFQPFSRAPQIRYRHSFGGFQAIGALMWQSQFTSIGPDNARSVNYLKNSAVPEIYAGINYRKDGWLAGVGVEFMSIMPKTQVSIINNLGGVTAERTYKTKARVTGISFDAYVQYKKDDLLVSAKSIFGENLTQLCMLGGYGVTSVSSLNGRESYTPIRNSSTWINAVYGKKWRPGIFAGYMKNLGTSERIIRTVGLGTNIDQLTEGGIELTYNIGTWSFGAEATATTAWYGTIKRDNGRVYDTNAVTNYRIVGVASFSF